MLATSIISFNSIFSIFITCISIYLGGKVQLKNIIPPSISSTPITLHTLFASWAGMQFGPYIGAIGASFHAYMWYLLHSNVHVNAIATTELSATGSVSASTVTHPSFGSNSGSGSGKAIDSTACRRQFNLVDQRRTPLSFGYILGMVPCAAVAGSAIRMSTTKETFRIKSMDHRDFISISHPIVASAIGQTTTIAVGAIWIYVMIQHMNVDNDNSGQRGNFADKRRKGDMTLLSVCKKHFIPFLPGLLAKSILSWIMLEYSSKFFRKD